MKFGHRAVPHIHGQSQFLRKFDRLELGVLSVDIKRFPYIYSGDMFYFAAFICLFFLTFMTLDYRLLADYILLNKAVN